MGYSGEGNIFLPILVDYFVERVMRLIHCEAFVWVMCIEISLGNGDRQGSLLFYRQTNDIFNCSIHFENEGNFQHLINLSKEFYRMIFSTWKLN